MQMTSFGQAEASALMKVDKADGRTLYYRVTDNSHVEITAEQYYDEGGA